MIYTVNNKVDNITNSSVKYDEYFHIIFLVTNIVAGVIACGVKLAPVQAGLAKVWIPTVTGATNGAGKEPVLIRAG